MKKSTIFLLIVGIGLVAYLIWPLLVVLAKVAVTIGVIAVLGAIGWVIWYVARETSKNN